MTWLKQNASWLKWLLAIALLGMLLWLNRDGLADLSHRRIAWSLFLLAVVVRFGGLCLTFTRWWLLVVGIGLPLKWKDSFRLGMFCEACNFVGPGAAGGDLVKAVWLSKDNPERMASATATVLLDRILGMWALFVAGALASLIPTGMKLGPGMQWAVWLLWGGTVAGLIGLGLMLWPAFTHSRLMHWLTTLRGIGKIVRELMDSITFYQGKPLTIGLAGAMSLLGHVGFLSSFYLCAAALHGDRTYPGYAEHIVGLPLPEVLAAVPLTPGGIGTLEGAVAYFYQTHQQSLDSQSTPELLKAANANGLLTALAYRVTALLLGGIGVIVFFGAGRGGTVQTQSPTVTTLAES